MRFVLPAITAIVLAVAAVPAAAFEHRTPHSPCHGNDKSVVDEGHNGVLHCSAAWEMPTSNAGTFAFTLHEFPADKRPDDCAKGTGMKGTGGGHPNDWDPHWFYTPAHGEWVTWHGELNSLIIKYADPRDDGAANINPKFVNWRMSDWPTRYYFYCQPLPPKAQP